MYWLMGFNFLVLQAQTFPQVTICNLNRIRKTKMPPELLEKFPSLLNATSKCVSVNIIITFIMSCVSAHSAKRLCNERLQTHCEHVKFFNFISAVICDKFEHNNSKSI